MGRMRKPVKVYVVVSSYDYEGWGLPDMITTDRARAIQYIRDLPSPAPVESYGVYEYTLEERDQGDLIADRSYRRPVWERPEGVA